MTVHLNDGFDLAYCKSDAGPLTADPDETSCRGCLEQLHRQYAKDPVTAIDGKKLVHLTWLRRDAEIHTSLCSSVTNPIRVIPCEQEYATCLYCIDIVDRFW